MNYAERGFKSRMFVDLNDQAQHSVRCGPLVIEPVGTRCGDDLVGIRARGKGERCFSSKGVLYER